MAQPLRTLNRNTAISNKQNVLVNLKPIKSNNQNDENVGDINQQKLSSFRSKIPVFNSRVNLNSCNDLKVTKPLDLKCNENKKLIQKQQSITIAKSEQEKKANIENIDAESNCFLLTDYAPEIYKYLHELEKQQALKPNFLAKFNLITPNMRAVVINWLIGVHKNFRMNPETLYLTVSIIDRILSRERIEKEQLQLLGATAMFVASKFEEIYYPEVKDFVILCDNFYSKKDILRMELRILNVTNFELSGPSPLYFLRRGSKAAHADSRVHMIGKYLCELSLIDYQFAHWLPSMIASTALYLALVLVNSEKKILDNNKQHLQQNISIIDDSSIWTPTIEHYTGYSLKDVRKNSAVMCRLVISSETSKHQNCRKKYASSKYLEISDFSTEWMKIIKKIANTVDNK